MQQVLKFVSQMVTKALADATEENNTIYHKSVPDSVPSRIEAYACVKAVPPPGIYCEAGADPFTSIIPYAATQGLSLYSERKAVVVRGLMKTMQEANDIASMSLSSMELPGTVQALEVSSASVLLRDSLLLFLFVCWCWCW
jgi:tyrosine-protein phosphatase non-receptor type 23